MDTVYKLGAALTLKDLISAPFAKITGNADKIRSKLEQIDGGIKKFESSMRAFKIGSGLLAAGTGMTFFSKKLLDAGRETSQFQSNLESLGIEKNFVSKITVAAMRASSKFKVIRNEFLDAAYDIKSGIETINEAEIGKFTEMVAKTATATKGSTKQLASLFGTVYNQNKELYKNLSDADFGALIGNSISFAVKMYKTEGTKMQQAIESVSGTAAKAGYDIAEQVNVLGMLQNVLPSGEAGTGFRSFVDKAVEASKKLGMSFVDQKGKILPVVDIIEKLKMRYGETIEATEAAELKKAFGSEEAMKLVTNLWDKTGKLRQNIDALRAAKGVKFLDEMALANIDNMDTGLQTLSNTWDNLKSTIGDKGIWEAIKPFAGLLKDALAWMVEIGNKYPTLTKWAGGMIALGTAVSVVGGAFMMLKGASGLYALSQMAAAGATQVSTFALIKKAAVSKIAAVAQWALNASLWACPLTWIIGGIIALGLAIYGIVKYWDLIKAKALGAWNWIKAAWGGAPGWVHKIFAAVALPIRGFIWLIRLIVNNFGSIKAAAASVGNFLVTVFKKTFEFLKNFWTSTFSLLLKPFQLLIAPVKWVLGKIAKLLPKSDAEEGPLSKLSFSGRALVRTFNTGIETEARKTPAVLPYIKKSSDVLSGSASGKAMEKDSRKGFVINVKSLIGELNMNGKTANDNLGNLAQRMAEAIMTELLRYENA